MSLNLRDIVQPFLLDLVSSFHMVNSPSSETGLVYTARSTLLCLYGPKGFRKTHASLFSYVLLWDPKYCGYRRRVFAEETHTHLWANSFPQRKIYSEERELFPEGRSPWGQTCTWFQSSLLENKISIRISTAVFNFLQGAEQFQEWNIRGTIFKWATMGNDAPTLLILGLRDHKYFPSIPHPDFSDACGPLTDLTLWQVPSPLVERVFSLQQQEEKGGVHTSLNNASQWAALSQWVPCTRRGIEKW